MRLLILNIIFLLTCSHVVFPAKTQASENTTSRTDSIRFNGIRIDLDLVAAAQPFYMPSNFCFQGALQADLNKSYFPVVEMGYAKTNKDINSLLFITQAPFGKLGIDFSLIKPKEGKAKSKNQLTGGLRLAYTNFTFNATNVSIIDENGQQSVSNFENLNASKLWIELVLGLRVNMYKNIFIGWSVRNKKGLNNRFETIEPIYIPGYGKNNDNNWEINYILGYKF